jgi:hypothetical protein
METQDFRARLREYRSQLTLLDIDDIKARNQSLIIDYFGLDEQLIEFLRIDVFTRTAHRHKAWEAINKRSSDKSNLLTEDSIAKLLDWGEKESKIRWSEILLLTAEHQANENSAKKISILIDSLGGRADSAQLISSAGTEDTNMIAESTKSYHKDTHKSSSLQANPSDTRGVSPRQMVALCSGAGALLLISAAAIYRSDNALINSQSGQSENNELWGAYAYPSGSGDQPVFTYDQASSTDAEKLALDLCKKEGGTDCIAWSFGRGFAALADSTDIWSPAGNAISAEEARELAMGECIKNSSKPETCKIRHEFRIPYESSN